MRIVTGGSAGSVGAASQAAVSQERLLCGKQACWDLAPLLQRLETAGAPLPLSAGRQQAGLRQPRMRSCLREVQTLAAMPAHRHIVGQYRAWQEGGHLYIQMQLCERGSLAHIIRAQAQPVCCVPGTRALWQSAGQAAPAGQALDSSTCLQGRLTEPQAWQVLWQVAQACPHCPCHLAAGPPPFPPACPLMCGLRRAFTCYTCTRSSTW